jgi:hypothetical protein
MCNCGYTRHGPQTSSNDPNHELGNLISFRHLSHQATHPHLCEASTQTDCVWYLRAGCSWSKIRTKICMSIMNRGYVKKIYNYFQTLTSHLLTILSRPMQKKNILMGQNRLPLAHNVCTIPHNRKLQTA